MANIYDVAKAADVSITAVSLVMNDPMTPRVGVQKRKKILDIANKLGYKPSGLAKALSRGATRILGLVVPMRGPIFFNNFIAAVLAGIQSCVMDRGYHLMIYSHSARSGRITEGELTQSRFVDGVIVFNTRLSSLQDIEGSIEDLKKACIPFVMTNCYAGEVAINYVGADDMELGRRGAEFLAERGHSRVALIGGAARSPMTPQILSGFKAGLAHADVRFDPKLYFCSEYDPATVHDGIVSWFALPHPPTAIFCADGMMVPNVYRALEELHLKIPEDVSVLGREYTPVDLALKPQLTTFALDGFEMGKKAAELLIEVLETKPASVKRIYLDAPLIKHESA